LGRVEFASAIFVTIAALISIIPIVPSIVNSVNSQVAQTIYSIFSLVTLLVGFVIYSIFTFRLGHSLLVTYFKSKIIFNAKIVTEKSKPYLGGYLAFQAEISGWLYAGYVSARIKTEFEEDQIFRVEYDKKKKMGNMHRLRKNHQLQWKWKIPNDFSDGEHEISIALHDTENIFFIWKGDTLRREINYKVIITRHPKNIEIQKITRPTIKTINEIDLNSTQISGWICVKVYNDTDVNHSGCYGQAIINNTEFPLYDYEEFLKRGSTENIDAYTSFTLEQNSIKRLYANIELTRTQKEKDDQIKISIDIGKEEIVRELPLKF